MYIRLINREITASRWPWQKRTSINWSDTTNKVGDRYGWRTKEPMGRFGGGWNYELGIHIGGSTVMIQLLFGSVSISKPSRCLGCSQPLLKGQSKGKWTGEEWEATKYHVSCWDTKKASEPKQVPPPPPVAPVPFADDDIPF